MDIIVYGLIIYCKNLLKKYILSPYLVSVCRFLPLKYNFVFKLSHSAKQDNFKEVIKENREELML